MIEQFTPGMSQVSQPAAGALRDRQSANEQDEKSASFEDHVSKAGERQPPNGGTTGEDARTDAGTDKLPRPVDGFPKAVFELSAALKGRADAAQQVGAKVANARDGARSADKSELTERQAEAALAKLIEKARHSAKSDNAEAIDEKAADQQSMTASDELSLLLGLTREAEPRHGKKGAADAVDKSEKKADSEEETAGKLDGAKDAVDLDPMLMTIDKKRGDDGADADDGSAKGETVRVVSANGRGRSVDIDVPAIPGTQAQDGAKQASTPKIETATVLEARRYLGFATETNGVALATAVKADPTWSEALQSAQRADTGTLARTVTEVNTLKLQMNPENLGSMVASLKLKGEELTVELRVTSVEAYRQLTADHDDIVKSLQDQGFSIDKVTVQLNATERTDTGADRDFARQQGQAQRDGQAQREGQGSQPGRDDAQRGQQDRPQSGNHADGASGDGRAEPGRSGNIYL